MKSKLFLSAIVAGALFLNSCSTGVTEETKTKMATFEAQWQETSTQVSNWGNDLTNQYNKCKEHVDKQTAMMTSMPEIKDEAKKAQLMTLDNNDKANLAELENMKNQYTNFETEWKQNTTDYTAWKEKVDKGEVNNTDAATAMTDWNGKLETAKNKLTEWNTAYTTTKAKSDADMAACDAMMTETTPPAPKK
jgi:chromosome segregation ATPase